MGLVDHATDSVQQACQSIAGGSTAAQNHTARCVASAWAHQLLQPLLLAESQPDRAVRGLLPLALRLLLGFLQQCTMIVLVNQL